MRIFYVYIYTVCACITEFEKKEKFHAEYVSVITQERKCITVKAGELVNTCLKN